MRLGDLAVFVLQDIGKRTLQNSGNSTTKTRGVLAKYSSATAGFDSDQAHIAILDEFVESADRVRSAADAGNHGSGKPAFLLKDLLLHLAADAAMEIANHGWIGVRSQRAAQ